MPSVAGDEALKLGVEIVAASQRFFDPGIAQHAAAVGQQLLHIKSIDTAAAANDLRG